MSFNDLNIEEKYELFKGKNIEEMYEDLKGKVESKKCSQKEYKEYLKVCNLKDNLFIIDNLMNYIKDLKKEIIQLEKEKENRQMYRELQKNELYLKGKMKSLDEKNVDLQKKLSENSLVEEEIIRILNQITDNNKINNSLKEELIKVKEQIDEKEPQQKKIYSYEKQRIVIIKTKEKIHHVSIVLDYLLNGNSWNETLEYYMEWQKSKYNLDSKNINVINDDIKEIRYDTKMGKEIIEIAYNYDQTIFSPWEEGDDR